MYRVMIADDEMIERMVLYKTLQKHLGDVCEIYEAENGREALEVYKEKQIQIAILDIEMPGIGGIMAAEKIRETDPRCCIIFLTAFDEFNYAKKAITLRALDYLLKPYQEEELLAVMEEAIRQTEKQIGQAEARPVPEEPEEPELMIGEDETQEPGIGRILKVSDLIRDYIRQNYMKDISMQDAARMMNYSEAYFCKLFKQCFSCNFTSYLTRFRMEEAKKLLAEPTVNVKNVGEAVGYSDSNYFAKVFKRYTGSSPTEYRTELFQQK